MRNPAVPLALLFVVAAATFLLAVWHPFSPSVPAAASLETLDGDPIRGARVFAASCAGCHGANATGGVGPSLVGVNGAKVLVVVQSGKGVMPARIVSGQDLADVAAYVATLSE